MIKTSQSARDKLESYCKNNVQLFSTFWSITVRVSQKAVWSRSSVLLAKLAIVNALLFVCSRIELSSVIFRNPVETSPFGWSRDGAVVRALASHQTNKNLKKMAVVVHILRSSFFVLRSSDFRLFQN